MRIDEKQYNHPPPGVELTQPLLMGWHTDPRPRSLNPLTRPHLRFSPRSSRRPSQPVDMLPLCCSPDVSGSTLAAAPRDFPPQLRLRRPWCQFQSGEAILKWRQIDDEDLSWLRCFLFLPCWLRLGVRAPTTIWWKHLASYHQSWWFLAVPRFGATRHWGEATISWASKGVTIEM
jgi:hypothetical protein